MVVLVPVLAVGGVFRGINNSRVNNQIESRQTLLPIVLEEEEKKFSSCFFPCHRLRDELRLAMSTAEEATH